MCAKNERPQVRPQVRIIIIIWTCMLGGYKTVSVALHQASNMATSLLHVTGGRLVTKCAVAGHVGPGRDGIRSSSGRSCSALILRGAGLCYGQREMPMGSASR